MKQFYRSFIDKVKSIVNYKFLTITVYNSVYGDKDRLIVIREHAMPYAIACFIILRF